MAKAKAPGSATRLVHDHWFRHAAWSPDGARFALGAYDAPTLVCDGATGETVASLAAQGHGVAWSPDGARLLTGSGKGAFVWDPSTKKKLLALKGHRHAVNAVAWSPDGARLATASGDSYTPADWSVRLWDAATGAELGRTRLPSRVSELAWSPDGATIAAVSDHGSRLWLCDAGHGAVREVAVRSTGRSVRFTADSARVLVATVNGPAAFVDVAAGAVAAWWDGAAWGDGPPPKFAPGPGFGAVACAHRGSVVALSHGDRSADERGVPQVTVLDLDARRTVATFTGGAGLALALDFSPDDARLLLACADHTARVHRAGDGAVLLSPRADAEGIARAIRSFPDGLVALGPAAWTAMVAELDSPDARTRAVAAMVPGRVVRVTGTPLAGIDPSLPARLRAAARDADPVMRRYALASLAAESPVADDVTGLLEAALDDPDNDVKLAAAGAYRRHVAPGGRALAAWGRALGSDSPSLRAAAVGALEAHGDGAVDLLWGFARDADDNVHYRTLDALLARKAAAHAGARRGIDDESPRVRAIAARVLEGALGEAAVRARVAAALGDAEPLVRAAAAWALGGAGAVTGAEVGALTAMAREGDWNERAASLYALVAAGEAGRAAREGLLAGLSPERLVEVVQSAMAVTGADALLRHWAERGDEAVQLAVLGQHPSEGAVAAALGQWVDALAEGKASRLRDAARWWREALARSREEDEG
jgi:sugar lactone lactonase YvrE